jgi:hypothetical protein
MSLEKSDEVLMGIAGHAVVIFQADVANLGQEFGIQI